MGALFGLGVYRQIYPNLIVSLECVSTTSQNGLWFWLSIWSVSGNVFGELTLGNWCDHKMLIVLAISFPYRMQMVSDWRWWTCAESQLRWWLYLQGLGSCKGCGNVSCWKWVKPGSYFLRMLRAKQITLRLEGSAYRLLRHQNSLRISFRRKFEPGFTDKEAIY